jgi:hypothetical protein
MARVVMARAMAPAASDHPVMARAMAPAMVRAMAPAAMALRAWATPAQEVACSMAVCWLVGEPTRHPVMARAATGAAWVQVATGVAWARVATEVVLGQGALAR